MKSKTIKTMSHVALGAGLVSVVVSGAVYVAGQLKGTQKQQNNGHFIGLWAPTFLILAELLDRIAVEDDRYAGVTIERGVMSDALSRGREMIHK